MNPRTGKGPTKNLEVRIDKTPPLITFDATQPPPNAAAWHNADVVVSFLAHDGGSGVDRSDPDECVVINGEGRTLRAIVKSFDRAGNVLEQASEAVNIDRHAPVTRAGVSGVPADGQSWFAPVGVTLEAHDDLSGVLRTEYSLNGGTWMVYEPDTPIQISLPGNHEVQYKSTDLADDVERVNVLAVEVRPSNA